MQICVFSGCWNSLKTDRSHGRKWRSDGRVQYTQKESQVRGQRLAVRHVHGREGYSNCRLKWACFPVKPQSKLIKSHSYAARSEIMFMFKWQRSVLGGVGVVIMVGAHEQVRWRFISLHWPFRLLFVLFTCISLNRRDRLEKRWRSVLVNSLIIGS